MSGLLELDLSGVAQALDKGETTAVALLELSISRIAQTKSLNTFITLDESGAMAAALAADKRRKEGRTIGPLDGVPIALKDLIATEGLRTTAASRMLENWIPPYDAEVATRLKNAGAVVVGKTNLDEFAMGSSNEHSAFGPVRNPHDETKVPGGSSGGSAAAVAARQVFASLGTDTGGSIRQPAAMCGVCGIKPTYGRVSRRGVVAFASSLDQVGPLARSTRDLAVMLQAIAGHDPNDSTSVDRPVDDFSKDIEGGIEGLRIGVPAAFFVDGMDKEVEASVRRGIDALADAGAKIVDVDLPHTEHALSTYYVICTAEASANLARYDGVRYGHRANERELVKMYERSRTEGFGDEVKRRIILGTYVLSAGYYDAYYGRAQKVRTLIRQDFERAFESVDVIVTPTSPEVAFDLNARTRDPLTMYLSDIYTLSINLAGLPALSVPADPSAGGLPIGLQMIGPWFEEARLLRAARTFERRHG